jgi:hypothetical protein
VFFIPNGLIGLLQAATARAHGHGLADLLEGWAARLRGASSAPRHRAIEPRTRQNGADPRGAPYAAAPDDERKAQP